ncbi:hypothetical protein B0H66DRAFT_608090 [Apodospora peruviana]|uniref:Uncharacterized protein n=1 Tax=Apodospora peruviana TaxID=516989 RepID=A0AAE0HUB1_9PEZI|nr:hypothetical protein B0H66DRAFT_608090 [Apodospora peruviana]
MGKDSDPLPAAMQEPGPHGFPMRWVLFVRGCKTLKMGTSTDSPIHYIKWHTFRKSKPWQTMHASAHKADKSLPLVAIYKPKIGWFRRPRDFAIQLFDKAGKPSERIDMKRTEASNILLGNTAKEYQFTMRTGADGHMETFCWRKRGWGSHCDEIQLIHKEADPPVHTGDSRPPRKEGFHFSTPYDGWILVRLNGGRRNNDPVKPLGYTDEGGEEIVASWCRASGWVAARKIIFQFWGAAGTGELGEEFTRIAALSGTTIWDDEEREAQRRRNKNNSSVTIGGGGN